MKTTQLKKITLSTEMLDASQIFNIFEDNSEISSTTCSILSGANAGKSKYGQYYDPDTGEYVECTSYVQFYDAIPAEKKLQLSTLYKDELPFYGNELSNIIIDNLSSVRGNIAIGANSEATGYSWDGGRSSIAIGLEARATSETFTGGSDIAIGHAAKAIGSASLAIGYRATAEGPNEGIAIGAKAYALDSGIAIGYATSALYDSVAVGRGNDIGSYGVAFGLYLKAHNRGVVIGNYLSACDYSVILGNKPWDKSLPILDINSFYFSNSVDCYKVIDRNGNIVADRLKNITLPVEATVNAHDSLLKIVKTSEDVEISTLNSAWILTNGNIQATGEGLYQIKYAAVNAKELYAITTFLDISGGAYYGFMNQEPAVGKICSNIFKWKSDVGNNLTDYIVEVPDGMTYLLVAVHWPDKHDCKMKKVTVQEYMSMASVDKRLTALEQTIAVLQDELNDITDNK